MNRVIKISISTACFSGGLLKAPPPFLLLMITLIFMMSVGDIWRAINPILKSMHRRNEFLYRSLHRSEWPVKPVDMPAIPYKNVTFEEALRNNPFMKEAYETGKK